MKTLYEFKLTDDKKKEHTYRIIKPNRRQIENAEMEYAVKLSECIKRGILTKTMLAKKYSDTGGLMSEKQAKRLMGLYQNIAEKTNEYARLSALQRKTKPSKKAMEALEGEIAEIKREIVDIETSNINLFNDTAESKAQNEVVKWYMINLSQTQVDGEWEDIYDGENYEEKLDAFYEKEDSEEVEEIYLRAMARILSVISLWFYNQGQKQEDFDALLEEYSGEEESEESEKSGEEIDDSSDETES